MVNTKKKINRPRIYVAIFSVSRISAINVMESNGLARI